MASTDSLGAKDNTMTVTSIKYTLTEHHEGDRSESAKNLMHRLPTPVQSESVPLILGGGDVMVAAETGSGKTGAFALPVLQLVHETLTARQSKGASSSPGST